LVYPEITAVEQPLEKMAEEAVRLLLAKIDNPAAPVEKVVLHADMVIRSSSETE
jgi:DNA-binding LacI/PurR family transcriptional regulator